MIAYYNEKTYKIYGSSTDEKPILDTDSNGSSFWETDTGTSYIYDAVGKIWNKVSSSGGSATVIEEIDTATEMNATMAAENEGKYYKFTGDSTSTFTKNGIYKVQYQTSTWAFWDYSGDISKITLISFTIAGTSYQAEEGMTWTEWCASSYNTDGYKIYESSYIVNKDENKSVGTSQYSAITNTYAKITAGTAYELVAFKPWHLGDR